MGGQLLSYLVMLAFYAIPLTFFTMLLLGTCLFRRWVVFAGFSLLGLALGMMSVYAYKESMFYINPPGIYLGDSLYEYFIHNLGNPNSFYSHYSIPWIVRTPQLFLFTSVIAWGFIGAVIQIIYNVLKKPAVAGRYTGVAIASSLAACLCIATAAIYLRQDATQRYGPTGPSATPVIEINPPLPIGTSRPPPPVTYANTTTYQAESLLLSASTIPAGGSIAVNVRVKNTGPGDGMAEVQLKVNGETLSSRKVALTVGETRDIKFVVMVPKAGLYTLSIGETSEDFEVV